MYTKFRKPSSPAFNAGELWTSSSKNTVEIVASHRWGGGKWDVDVCYKQADGTHWMKDAWNFQVRYQYIPDLR